MGHGSRSRRPIFGPWSPPTCPKHTAVTEISSSLTRTAADLLKRDIEATNAGRKLGGSHGKH